MMLSDRIRKMYGQQDLPLAAAELWNMLGDWIGGILFSQETGESCG